MTHFITIFALLQGPGTEPTVSPGCALLSNRQNPHTGSLTCGVRLIMENQVEVTRTDCTQEKDCRDQRHHQGLKRCGGADPTPLFTPHSLQKTGGSWRMTFVVQSLCRVRLFATPWTAAHQASLSSISQSLLKLMSIKSDMPSNHSSVIPFSSCLQSFPASGAFLMSRVFSDESAVCIRWPKY